MSLAGWMWCVPCKAWRVVHGRGAYAHNCHRCGWDMRARVAPKWSTLAAWRRGEDLDG